jgi:type IV pilus assembly protein PilV
MSFPTPAPRIQRGASLVEVMVAITIFSVGLLGLLGMHATSMSFLGDSKYRADAALLADALINQVWVDRANLAGYAYAGAPSARAAAWAARVGATLPAGAATVAVNGATVQVTVRWTPSGGQQRQHVAVTTVQGP